MIFLEGSHQVAFQHVPVTQIGSRKMTRDRSMTCSAKTVQKRFQYILLQHLGSDDAIEIWDQGLFDHWYPIYLRYPSAQHPHRTGCTFAIAKCLLFIMGFLMLHVPSLPIPNSSPTWFWGRNATAFVGISLMWPALLTSTPSLGGKIMLFLRVLRKHVDGDCSKFWTTTWIVAVAAQISDRKTS